MTDFAFVLYSASDPSRTIIRRCLASSLTEARGCLRPSPEEYVESEASYRMGWPRPLAADRCTSCGQRPRLGPKTPRCRVCEPRIHEGHQRASRARRDDDTLAEVRAYQQAYDAARKAG